MVKNNINTLNIIELIDEELSTLYGGDDTDSYGNYGYTYDNGTPITHVDNSGYGYTSTQDWVNGTNQYQQYQQP